MRFFNTAGPIQDDIHYCIPPLERWNLEEVLSLIAQRKYFVLHAPRQTGKTSCLLALVKYLNERGGFRAIYSNVEPAQAMREDVAQAMAGIVHGLGRDAEFYLGDTAAVELAREVRSSAPASLMLEEYLARWCQQSPTPAAVMLDEVDALVGDTLISLLRQLRSGYNRRPAAFPQSIILCGVRDVRDYRIHSSAEKSIITGGSAFNIKAASLRLGDFNREEMERLYAEHTSETGQTFEPGALDAAWELSCGQPWVVNALAYEACFELKEGRDRARPVSQAMIEQAGENLILRRETHLDQLADKLAEPRVRRVIEPLLSGTSMTKEASDEDLQYVLDLGLIRIGSEGPEIANGIYREVIPRQLTSITEHNFEAMVKRAWYVRSDGSLDMEKLLTDFQQFFRENAEHWTQRFDYQEAGPQLLLQAYLQRVVNGGGLIHREYGLGRGRTDLLVRWKDQRIVLELKVVDPEALHRTLARTIEEGLAQTAQYMDRCGTSEGHLILFDRTPGKPWEEKIWRREEKIDGKSVTTWGM
ncbi:MAG TPA: AAA family ATPase [Armatimonadota bacterium]|nr:AAA family ATPase [Armatimonadota bacterium]